MVAAPLYIVDIIGEVVTAVDTALFSTLNKHILYQYGRSIQILNVLQTLNNSITIKDGKYPLFALFQPFSEKSGGGYYASVKFPRISIACLTQSTDPVKVRYTKNFKTILYPIFTEFFRQLARHPNIVGNDPNAFDYTHWDLPGTDKLSDQVKGATNNDVVDAILITDLTVQFKQVKSCKSL